MHNEILHKIGLTREQVMRLTQHMRPPVADIRVDEDIQSYIWAKVKTWRSFWLPDLAHMCRVTPVTLSRWVRLMADAGYPIGTEKVYNSVGPQNFVCLKELITEKD